MMKTKHNSKSKARLFAGSTLKHLFRMATEDIEQSEKEVRKHEEVPQYDVVLDENLAQNKYPVFTDQNTSKMKQVLTPALFEKLKDYKTQNGWTLAKAINTGVVNEDSLVGCHAGDVESYTVFKDLFDPVIEAYHGGYTPDMKHVTDLDPDKLVGDIDDTDMIRFTRIRVTRNIYGFQLNPSNGAEARLDIEKLMRQVFFRLNMDLAGTYHSLVDLTTKQKQQLVNDHLLFKSGDRFQIASGYHNHWPAGRGIYFNTDKTFLVWLNEGDHLRIISMEKGGDVKSVFTRLARGVDAIERGIKKLTGNNQAFLVDDHLGMITCCPSNLGTGLRGGVHIALPASLRKIGTSGLEEVCCEMGCQVRGMNGEHTSVEDTCICDISNLHRIGKPEYVLVQDMVDCVNELVKMEREYREYRYKAI